MERYFDQVMILEDDEPTTYLIKLELEQQKCCNSIISFYTPTEALEYLGKAIQKGEQLPDMIFSDLNLPRMNGWEFLEAFNEQLTDRSTITPLIYILSTSMNPDDVTRAHETALVSGFLEKPLNREKIQSIIESNNLVKKESE